MSAEALAQQFNKLFVLTTRTAHWFVERGFNEVALDQLPDEKKALYNYERRSKVFMKTLDGA
jgi:amino-acid N-acetyltransferase